MTFRIRFAKYGVVKFIGHLDVMRYFQKVNRRSELPVKYSQGFNPHQILSFGQPLGVGITSDGEYMEVDFEDAPLMAMAGVKSVGQRDIGNGVIIELPDPKDAPKLEKVIFDGMSAETYEGFAIIDVCLLPPPKPNVKTDKAMSLVSAADYMVSLKDGYSVNIASPEEFLEKFDKFMRQDSISIVKKSKKTEKELDIKPYIYMYGDISKFDLSGIAHADEYESGQRVFLRLAAGSVMNIRPELVMEAFCEFLGIEYNNDAFQVHRMETYIGEGHNKSLLGRK